MRKPVLSTRKITGFLALSTLALSTVPVLAQSATIRSIETIRGRPGTDTLPPELVRALPRHRLFTAASGADECITARRDGNVWSAVRSTRSRFVVEGFPLEGEAPVDLVLQPFRVTGPNTQFVIGRKGQPDVPFDFDASSISLFRGSVLGHAGSHVYLALSDRMTSGYVDLGPGRQRLHISSKDAAGRALAPGEISVFEPQGTLGLPAGVPV
ncbi:MAG: hypothetical protein IID42_09740, partial [Planctomycetes bacterium]|nr:hypothetical protein [Planctomycetota bacterium]